jgi:hypothetical protein
MPPVSPPADSPAGAALAVAGQLTGLAPEADEARALLAALEAAGLGPAARDVPAAFIAPRLEAEEWAPVLAARSRPLGAAPAVVSVPVGAFGAGGHILRLAGDEDAIPGGASSLWVADPAAARALGPRAEWVPPAIPAVPLGPGGEGTLVVAPAHDLPATAAALRAAAREDGLRVLPTADTAPLAALVRELAPHAELLAPCASELRFAALAAGADTVLCADPADRYQRRRLLAAAAGADGGPVAAVDLDDGMTRAERRAAVLAACAPRRVAERVLELLACPAAA